VPKTCLKLRATLRLVPLLVVLIALGFAGCDSHDTTLNEHDVRQAFSSAGLPLVDSGLVPDGESPLRKVLVPQHSIGITNPELIVALFRSDAEGRRYAKLPPGTPPLNARRVRNVLVYRGKGMSPAQRESVDKAVHSLESQ
jgi:hypothetical protein